MTPRTRQRQLGATVLILAAIACIRVGISDVSASSQAQQPRDAQARPAAGTALLGGVVTSQDDSARPLRRVLVTLSGAGVPGNLQAMTDDNGRFAFPDLPAGRYTLTAEKPAYVKTYYGSKRIGRGPGTPIALAERQRLTDVTITLLRGAAIEGTILDENGVPLSSAQVRALQQVIINGERKFVSPPGSQLATSDDRGMYRLYGLPPGEYTVRAGGGGGIRSGVRLTTTEAIDAARRELQTGPAHAAAQPAGDAPRITRSGAYLPGVPDAALAEFFTLAAGQERTGVDVRNPLVRSTRLEGTAVGPSGQPVTNAMMGLADAASGSLWTSIGGIRPRADGRFSIGSLTPGRYLLFGRGTDGDAPANPSMALPLWASAEVVVSEQDYLDLVVQFLPGVSVSGKVAFRGSQPHPDLTKMRISLNAAPAIAGTALSAPAISAQPDGSFAFTGVAPGRYRLSITGGGSWSLRSAIVDGRDTLDGALEVQPGRNVSDVAVIVIDQPTEISGTLFDQLGRPTPEYAIVVFSTDRAHWTTAPRRMSGVVKLGSDGRFSVAGLPPGEYLVAALVDPDPSQLADVPFLEQLAGTAIRITLGESEKRVQDLTLARGTDGR